MNFATNWRTMTIEEVTDRLIDYRGKTPPKTDSGVRLITAKVVKGGRILDDKPEFIAENFYDQWMRRGLPQQWDVLITTEAPLGEVAILRDPERIALAQRIILLRGDPEIIDQKYLFYALQSEFTQAELNGRATGTTVSGIKQSELRKVRLQLPDLPTQRRIAGILSAYDDLIENNLRRIRILEEMAQSLYREWFVHFRFPGHEAVHFVDSPLGRIPNDWKVVDLAAVCIKDKGIQTGPFGSQLHESDYSDEGVPVVMPKDLIGFRIRTNSIARIPEETADNLARHRMQQGDIVYGRRGDIGRRAFIMPRQVGWFCGTGCLRIRPDPNTVNGWFVFNFLGQDNVASLISGRAQGVTMPNLNTGILSSVPVTLPPRAIQEHFARLSFPLAEARESLHAKIQTLRKTRDLLLPKLLNNPRNP